MSFKINLKPTPGAEYFTLREHLYRYNMDVDMNESMERIESKFKNLFHIPPDFKFNLLPISKWNENGVENKTIFLDDPVSGMRHNKLHAPILQEHGILDLSYSFPQLTGLDFQNIKLLLIETRASLGIPGAFKVVCSRKSTFEIDFLMKEGYKKDMYMLDNVMSDIEEKGLDILLRESNYKAAVLYQLIESNVNLETARSKKERSKTMIAFKCEKDFLFRIEKLGYEFYVDSDSETANVVIANYATQSKELIEMFADRVARL